MTICDPNAYAARTIVVGLMFTWFACCLVGWVIAFHALCNLIAMLRNRR